MHGCGLTFVPGDVGAPAPQPVSAPLQSGIRFFQRSYPRTSHWLSLRTPYLPTTSAGTIRVTMFRLSDRMV